MWLILMNLILKTLDREIGVSHDVWPSSGYHCSSQFLNNTILYSLEIGAVRDVQEDCHDLRTD